MQEYKFQYWLENTGISKRPISDALSRCRRIENGFGIDLDAEYKKDGGRSIIDLLTYTTEDAKNNRPAPKGIDFSGGANIKNGMASLRSAAKKYFEFCASK